MQKDWVTVGQLSALTGQHRATIIEHIDKGTLAAFKIGNAWCVSRTDAEEYVSAVAQQSSPETSPHVRTDQ